MATPTRKRVGTYNPDIETGDVLDDIAEQDVVIASVAFDERSGQNGPYTLSIITLDDGRIFHTGSKVVSERLAQVPVGDFPVDAKFSLVASASHRGQSYWTVS
jgi:hypothetical protein